MKKTEAMTKMCPHTQKECWADGCVMWEPEMVAEDKDMPEHNAETIKEITKLVPEGWYKVSGTLARQKRNEVTIGDAKKTMIKGTLKVRRNVPTDSGTCGLISKEAYMDCSQ